MPVSPDAVNDNNGDNDQRDGEQYRPDFQYPVGGGVDEEGGERQHEGELQYPGNQSFWRFQSSSLLSECFGAVFRDGVARNDNVGIYLIAPYIPTWLSAAGEKF